MLALLICAHSSFGNKNQTVLRTCYYLVLLKNQGVAKWSGGAKNGQEMPWMGKGSLSVLLISFASAREDIKVELNWAWGGGSTGVTAGCIRYAV